MVFKTGEDHLPEDEIFPEDLRELGFVISKDDKIRYVHSPDQSARYKINRNDRVNQAHLESLHKAIRISIYDRLVGIGMNLMKIPGAQPHAPIFISSNLQTASCVIVFFGEVVEDLGIFSYRDACDEGLSFGSVLGVANAVLGENAYSSPTALILANSGQNVWYNGGGVAMTPESFNARTRSSLVGRQRPWSRRNLIANNSSLKVHTQWIFDEVLKPNLGLGAKVHILGLFEGGNSAMAYLSHHWSVWGPHISSMSLVSPEVMFNKDTNIGDLTDLRSFASFRRFRCRAWVLSDTPIGTSVPGLELYGCNTYSCGEGTKTSCMITRGLGHIRSWMNVMYARPMAKEKLEMLPGETGLSDEVLDVLYNSIPFPEYPGLPCGQIEIHSRPVLKSISESVFYMWLTRHQITFSVEKDGDISMQTDDVDGSQSEGSFVDLTGDAGEAFSAPAGVPAARGTGDDILEQTGDFDLTDLHIIRDIE
ncbi:hypothetical protein N7457_008510 [Penicillium paradoxum]|uniref:uncharacterized protein n=1 Tax=Penicillium paradoxum TaxID=176176 RepID=UPI002546CCF1|nr:uncharacterized protein N7457_008510 [Penicillium paradoxum]KAJ5773614.1 hypothetical protein N7457_008510 [Penicillium paradoxum]